MFRFILVNIFLSGSLFIAIGELSGAEGAAFFGSDCGNNRSHNFYYGKSSSYDRLFYMTHIVKDYGFLRKISVDVDLPPPGWPSLGVISFIEVLDGYRDGNGGCCYIRQGGVGTDRVSLHLKSQRNQGIDFTIKVYGY